MPIEDVPVPGSAAARLAGEVATAYHSPALASHCVRSYIWAAALGLEEHVDFDAELLYVAAMLHDIGLVAAFDSMTVAFEHAGGHVAWVFASGAGWPADRRRRLSEVIVRHMLPAVARDEDPEGYLLEAATALDIAGVAPKRWPLELREDVMARYPRLDLAEEFVRCLRDQAQRKPTSQAARVVTGLAERMAAHPLEHG